MDTLHNRIFHTILWWYGNDCTSSEEYENDDMRKVFTSASEQDNGMKVSTDILLQVVNTFTSILRTRRSYEYASIFFLWYHWVPLGSTGFHCVQCNNAARRGFSILRLTFSIRSHKWEWKNGSVSVHIYTSITGPSITTNSLVLYRYFTIPIR